MIFHLSRLSREFAVAGFHITVFNIPCSRDGFVPLFLQSVAGEFIMKTVKLFASIFLTAGLSLADTTWNPAANGIYPPSTGNWNVAANWTAGLPDFADKASFTVNNAAECVVTNSVIAFYISLNANESTLRIINGGTLTTTNNWSAVGYSQKTNNMIVEAGGTANFGGHFWIGFSSTAVGIVDVNGGTISVAGNMGLGFNGDGGKGTLKIRNGGTVSVSSSFSSSSIVDSSVIDIETGSLIISGDKSTVVASYIASGKITGYGGSG
ncbi:MAG: hypothetical protein MUC65_08530, partial [Pontiellaceae bacterium]|nr:hypothetical protein [Pontiellaceae bacterium]